MPKHTDPADIVIELPSSDIILTAPFLPNPRKKKIDIAESIVPERAYRELLVRTALVRSEGYQRCRNLKMTSPDHIADLCKHLVNAPQEYVLTVCLSHSGHVMAIHETALGEAGHVSFSHTEMMRVVLLTGALAFVHVHNHPSGDPKPSPDDLRAYARLRDRAGCLGIDMLDAMILSYDGYWSKLNDTVEPWS